MTRPLTPAEKVDYKAVFPNLDVNAAQVSGEATPVYNCIAWTVAVTTRWIWPGPTLTEFDTFYRGQGFVRDANGPIAAWGHATSAMTHGSISGAGHGPRWESKCGEGLQIQHGLPELNGSNYGRVLAFYRKSTPLATEAERRQVMQEKTEPLITAIEEHQLSEQCGRIPRDIREQFDARFASWKETWRRGGLKVNSNPRSRAVGPEFDALIAFGSVVLPLIIQQLLRPENFFALQLYDAMQDNEHLIVQFQADDERIMEGEQGRAARVVRAWFANR